MFELDTQYLISSGSDDSDGDSYSETEEDITCNENRSPGYKGKIRFQHPELKIENSKFLHVSSESEDIVNFFIKEFNLKQPKLIISLIAGHSDIFLKNRERQKLKKLLIGIARSSGAWLITDGLKTGVAKLVGEALLEENIEKDGSDMVLLGICDNRGMSKHFKIKHRYKQGYEIRLLDKSNPLDEHHTHFLFIDSKQCSDSKHEDGNGRKSRKNSTADQFLTGWVNDTFTYIPLSLSGLNIYYAITSAEKRREDFRSKGSAFHSESTSVEKEHERSQSCVRKLKRSDSFFKTGHGLSTNAAQINFYSNKVFSKQVSSGGIVSENSFAATGIDTDNHDQAKLIPVIHVLIEGGVTGMRMVHQYLRHDMPVLVLEGTGRIADHDSLGGKLRELRSKACNVKTEETASDGIFEDDDIFYWLTDQEKSDIKEFKAIFKDLISSKYRKILNVINSSAETSDIVRAMYDTLQEAHKLNHTLKISLAVDWNLKDVAEREIALYQKRYSKKEQQKEVLEWILKALSQDKTDIVKLFFEVDSTLLEHVKVKELYKKFETSEKGAWKLLERYKTNGTKVAYCLFCGVDRDIGNAENMYTVGSFVSRLFHGQIANPYRESMEPDATSGLFMYSLMLNNIELAMELLKVVPNPLGSAVFGTSFLRCLYRCAKKEDENEISLRFLKSSKYLEKVTVGFLGECYQSNQEICKHLLVRKLDGIFHGENSCNTLLILASANEQMEFIGHDCCQAKLETLWKGNISPKTSQWRMFCGIWFPFLFNLLKIHFVSEESHSDDPKHKCKRKGKPTDMEIRKFNRKKKEQSAVNADSRVKKKRKCKDCRNFYEDFRNFYTSPCIMFFIHTITYMVFVTLFTIFVLTDLHPHTVHFSIYEYVIYPWAVSFIIEEVRQVRSQYQMTIRNKVCNWRANIWNKFDLLMYGMVFVSFLARFIFDETNFAWTRVIFSFTLGFHYIRLTHGFFIHREIGPKVFIMMQMLKDLTSFFFIFLIFVTGFGITYHANLFPNSPLSWGMLYKIIYLPYFQTFGELSLDILKGESTTPCSNNMTVTKALTVDRCPEDNGLVLIFGAMYMLLTSILLINLLIAMFSNTFERIEKDSMKYFKLNRYSLIHEYYSRPFLPPPLNVFGMLFRKLINEYSKDEFCCDRFVIEFTPKGNKKMDLFERAVIVKCLNDSQWMQSINTEQSHENIQY